MRSTRRNAPARALVCLLAGLGCSGQPATDGPTRDVATPPSASASVEPSEILIGDRIVLEIAVTSPPDRRLLPFATPESPAGFEVLAVEALPVEYRSDGWLHRTRLQLRAREAGSFAWPQTDLSLEAADGAATVVSLASVPLRVRSVLPAYPGRSEPFGARSAPERVQEAHPLTRIGIVGGCLLILLVLAAFALRRRTGRARPEAAPPAEPAWTEALGALGRAGAEPADAANAMATALRRYMARRFGAAAKALTSEELADHTPPFAATSRWPTFVSLLLDLDALRFRPRRGVRAETTGADRIEALRTRSRDFIVDSTPPEALQ